ncbi:hypothetical protein Tco_0512079 [Tanacetum coccineum]
MAAFWVLNIQLQQFIDLQYDRQMTDKYFAKYTRIKVKQFKDTLFQHMGIVKKSIVERHVIKDSMTEGEIESEVQNTNSRSGNDTNTYDADIRPIYDEELMVEVQMTTEFNIFATGKQHTEQPKIINEENEHLNKEKEHLKQTYKDLYDYIKKIRVQTKDNNDSLVAQMNKKSIENAELKAQIQEKDFAIAALKN